jgi:hypothetical protein
VLEHISWFQIGPEVSGINFLMVLTDENVEAVMHVNLLSPTLHGYLLVLSVTTCHQAFASDVTRSISPVGTAPQRTNASFALCSRSHEGHGIVCLGEEWSSFHVDACTCCPLTNAHRIGCDPIECGSYETNLGRKQVARVHECVQPNICDEVLLL